MLKGFLVGSLLLVAHSASSQPLFLEAVAEHAANPAVVVRGPEFPWNGVSPYAELQASGPLIVRAPANQSFILTIIGADPVMTKMAFTINGTRTETAGTPNAQGEFVLPPQTLPVGSHPASVEACHEFACSAPLAFTLQTVPPPSTPTGIRLGQVISASLRAFAEAVEQAIAARE